MTQKTSGKSRTFLIPIPQTIVEKKRDSAAEGGRLSLSIEIEEISITKKAEYANNQMYNKKIHLR